ncbi:hypothetical protein [Paenibacillus luteus]|uniref:hypothetical protein n=1 Tax=Paenibacillus luteus TaxID=2545753 RepID=UPI001375E09D|nr:hypothetical protein [Paenibacillus luteus]
MTDIKMLGKEDREMNKLIIGLTGKGRQVRTYDEADRLMHNIVIGQTGKGQMTT